MTKITVREPLMTKKQIRSLVRKRFKELDRSERDLRSEEACRSLYETYLRGADPMRVGLFMSMESEVQTAPLIRMLAEGEHRLLVPRCDDKETIRFYPMGDISGFEMSGYGIPEPTCPIEDEEVPDFLVVPGVAFSRLTGGRVGHGVGYYDRYLTKHSGEIDFVIGLGLEFQIFDLVPVDPHDYPLDAIAWEGNVVVFPQTED